MCESVTIFGLTFYLCRLLGLRMVQGKIMSKVWCTQDGNSVNFLNVFILNQNIPWAIYPLINHESSFPTTPWRTGRSRGKPKPSRKATQSRRLGKYVLYFYSWYPFKQSSSFFCLRMLTVSMANTLASLADIFPLQHESSIFRSYIQPCMWFLHDGTG